jgi:hypothetical protein
MNATAATVAAEAVPVEKMAAGLNLANKPDSAKLGEADRVNYRLYHS